MSKKWIMVGLVAFCLILAINRVEAIDYGPHPNETYYVMGCVVHPIYNLYYGSTQNQETQDHDGLVVMKYADTDSLYRTIKLDDGGKESVQSIALFSDGSFGVVLVKYAFNYTSLSYEFDSTNLIKYDCYGNVELEKELTEKYRYVSNIDYHLILSRDETYQADLIFDDYLQEAKLLSTVSVMDSFTCQYKGKASVNGEMVESIHLVDIGNYHIEITDFRFHYAFDVTIHPQMIGVEDGGNYTSSVSIHYSSDYLLDGTFYSLPVRISEIGYHQLVIEGLNGYVQTYDFVIEPDLGILTEGGTYEDKVDISIEGARLTLNGEIVKSPLFVAKPGFYELEIEGLNDYEKTVTFVIYPSVKNIDQGSTYECGYPVLFIGEAMLNNEWVDSGYIIDKPGNYELSLYFGDVLYKTVSFSIIESSETVTNKTISFPFLEVGLGVITLVGIYFVFRKK